MAAGSKQADLQQLADQLAEARREYARIATAIRNASSYYRSLLSADGAEATWSEQLRTVVGDENLLLLYYLGHKRSHLFVVGKGGEHVSHYDLEITARRRRPFGRESRAAQPARNRRARRPIPELAAPRRPGWRLRIAVWATKRSRAAAAR